MIHACVVGAGKGVPVMAWPARLAIALGSAKGLAYLHEDCKLQIDPLISSLCFLFDEFFLLSKYMYTPCSSLPVFLLMCMVTN